jgi:hypothetical protein
LVIAVPSPGLLALSAVAYHRARQVDDGNDIRMIFVREYLITLNLDGRLARGRAARVDRRLRRRYSEDRRRREERFAGTVRLVDGSNVTGQTAPMR